MTNDNKVLTEQEQDFIKRRRRRSIAIAVVLAALVVIFYAITVVKLGPEIMVRDL
ncbi:hypothetical protein [Pelagibacterium lentulum]|uniref:CoxF protein n=1 Tax=Pelagibacterium lentulum TaxID=2029865 RepID=A0A916VZS5_9HYPH|nr:hypothetical protein [Pelagibacterium lentulum]GGA56241.1 hypothetical protein GCM10011499_27970 [Pelagibacterium lentulum]